MAAVFGGSAGIGGVFCGEIDSEDQEVIIPIRKFIPLRSISRLVLGRDSCQIPKKSKVLLRFIFFVVLKARFHSWRDAKVDVFSPWSA